MWEFHSITHEWGGNELLFPQALRGIGQQFAVAPTVTLTLGGLPPNRLKLASGLFNLMRNLGGAIGIAACGTILNDRTNLHALRLSEHLSTQNPAAMQLMQKVAQSDAARLGGNTVRGNSAALKQLWSMMMREAQTLTFSDAFFAIMICFAVATIMVPLMRKVVQGATPPADAH
jgi:DHA2 family multidrug resistance protein